MRSRPPDDQAGDKSSHPAKQDRTNAQTNGDRLGRAKRREVWFRQHWSKQNYGGANYDRQKCNYAVHKLAATLQYRHGKSLINQWILEPRPLFLFTFLEHQDITDSREDEIED